MARKIIIAVTLLVTMAAFNSGLPLEEERENMQDKIDTFKQAIIDQDVQVGMDAYGRIFLPNTGTGGGLFSGLGGLGGGSQNKSLAAILAGAPRNTTSLTFIPLATILFNQGG